MAVVVGCNELRADSGVWARAAEDVRAAAQVAEGLTLADKLPPGLRGLAGSMITSYDGLRQAFTGALTGGVTALDSFSTAVRQIADTFEREDDERARQMAQAGEGE